VRVAASCGATAALVLIAMAATRAEPAAGSAADRYSLLAYRAAMEGRKAATLAAAATMAQSMSSDAALGAGDAGWSLTPQYAALVRFGLWDELLALSPPDAHASGLTAGYLYGRGVALAARGRLAEALADLSALQAVAAGLPESPHVLRAAVSVAVPIVAARIAATEGRDEDAIRLLGEAVAAEDKLAYREAAEWFFPVRHLLGAQLLLAGRAAEAERVYREDLARNPANGWSLSGLVTALRVEGRAGEAARVSTQLAAAWRNADVWPHASALWIAGPDTRSCECQQPPSAQRQTRGELLGAQHEAGVH